MQSFIPLALLFAFAGSVAVCGADNKNRNNNAQRATQERRDAERIQDAKEDVAKAQEKLKEDAKAAREAEAEAEKLLGVVGQKRKTLEESIDSVRKTQTTKLGLTNAISEHSELQKAFNEASQPVIAQLQSNDVYRQVALRAKDAEKNLATITQNRELTSEQRQQQTEVEQKAIRARVDMEVAAIRRVPELAQMMDQREALSNRIRSVQAELNRKVEQDPAVQKNKQSWEDAVAKHKQQLERVADLRRRLASDEAKLGLERRQVQAATMKDKANDKNRSGNNQNKPNKKK